MLCGIDEVGRGSLAGPVVSAAVVFKGKIDFKDELKDSKELSKIKREALVLKIKASAFYSIVAIDNIIISKINIHNASLLAMYQCFKQLKIECSQILVDGKFIPPIKHKNIQAIVRGDKIIKEIQAASILAKVERDKLMERVFEKKYPLYNFKKHKGYPTREHKSLIKKYGPCRIHRINFKLY